MSYINSKGEIVRGHERFSDESFVSSKTAPSKSSWCSVKFLLAALSVVCIALTSLALSNPSCEDFTNYLKNYSKAKGNFSTKLLSKLRRSYCNHNMFFSTAKYNNEHYIGIFGNWFENNIIDIDVVENNSYVKGVTRFIGTKYNEVNLSKVDDVELLLTVYIIVYCIWVFVLPYNFMSNHFAISRINLKAYRLHTLVTSSFSHNQIMHLTMNICMLTSIGDFVQQKLTRSEFWMLYIFSGVIGSIGSVIIHPIQYQSLGASGALYGFYGYLASTDAGKGLVVNWFGQNLNMSQALLVSLLFGALMSRGVVQGADNAMHVAGAVGGCMFPTALAALRSL
jgi:rhomboid protease GluP